MYEAVRDALRLGAISFDAVKHPVLCRIELVSEVPALLSTAKWCDERRNNIWKQCDK